MGKARSLRLPLTALIDTPLAQQHMVGGNLHHLAKVLTHGLAQAHVVNQPAVHHQGLLLTGLGQHAHPLHLVQAVAGQSLGGFVEMLCHRGQHLHQPMGGKDVVQQLST